MLDVMPYRLSADPSGHTADLTQLPRGYRKRGAIQQYEICLHTRADAPPCMLGVILPCAVNGQPAQGVVDTRPLPLAQQNPPCRPTADRGGQKRDGIGDLPRIRAAQGKGESDTPRGGTKVL